MIFLNFLYSLSHFQDGPTLKTKDRSYFFKVANTENQQGMKYLLSPLYKTAHKMELIPFSNLNI